MRNAVGLEPIHRADSLIGNWARVWPVIQNQVGVKRGVIMELGKGERGRGEEKEGGSELRQKYAKNYKENPA